MVFNSVFDFSLLGFIVPKHFENSVCFRLQVERGGRRDPNPVRPLERPSIGICTHTHTHTHTHTSACCTDQPITVDVIIMSCDSFRMQSVLLPSIAVVRVCVCRANHSPLARLQPGLLRSCGSTALRQRSFAVPRPRLPSHRPGGTYQQLEGGAEGSSVHGELVRFPGHQ